MVEITFNIRVEDGADAATQDERLFDDYELAIMLQQTKAQLARQVEQALGDLRCPEHDQAPAVVIGGTYSLESEQLEIQYALDTCCKPFLLRAVAALNRT